MAKILYAIIHVFAYIYVFIEDSMVGLFFHWSYGTVLKGAIQEKKSFNKFGLFTLYPILIVISFLLSTIFFVPVCCLCIVGACIAYPIMGIVKLGELIFLKQTK